MSETREVAKKSHWTVRLTTPKRALPEKEFEYQANVVCHAINRHFLLHVEFMDAQLRLITLKHLHQFL